MGLTAAAIKAAKGRAKQNKLTDSGGLHLLVPPSVGLYWRISGKRIACARAAIADKPMLIIGTQFAMPTADHIERNGPKQKFSV
jgi:hypothetical protein